MVASNSIIPQTVRRFLILVTKKCRNYAACGVSQTPNKYKRERRIKMEQNASHYPQLTSLFKEIVDDMSKDVLKEDFSIIVIDKYDWCVCLVF